MEGERPVRRITNSIRRLTFGEPASQWRSPNSRLSGLVCGAEVACQSDRRDVCVVGDGMVGEVERVNRGDLSEHRGVGPQLMATRVMIAPRSGVRASIVASKPGNSGGAKGRRKVDAR